jgi:hypothetical protein
VHQRRDGRLPEQTHKPGRIAVGYQKMVGKNTGLLKGLSIRLSA